MLESFQHALDSIPLPIIAFLTPLALWAQMAWASPFLKTRRHGKSALLAGFAGLMMALALGLERVYFWLPFVLACLGMAATLGVMIWPARAEPHGSTFRKGKRKFR